MIKIKLATNVEIVKTQIVEINLPSEPIYFIANQEYNFEDELFAIVPKFKNVSGNYKLIYVSLNEQTYTDFIPSSDCKRLSWINETGLRKKAWGLLTNSSDFHISSFKKCSEEYFNKRREELLNDYKQE